MPSYEPKGADVWSLGIVLLNLLFHRCPWADPTLDDPDFCAYRRNPIGFLETRFEGIGTEVATFLANKVFCDIEDDELPFSSPESANAVLPSSVATATPLSIRRSQKPPNRRVTAGEFGKWANKLVRYMGEGSRRASISDATYQMVASVRQSPRIDGAGGSTSRPFQSPQARSPRNSMEIQLQRISNNTVEASPSRKTKRLSIGLPNDLIEELENGGKPEPTPPPPPTSLLAQLARAPENASPLVSNSLEEAARNLSLVTNDRDHDPHNAQIDASSLANELSPEINDLASAKEVTSEDLDGEAAAKERHRRRKRGARRGKGQHRENAEGSEPPLSPSRSRSGTLGERYNGDETSQESPIINLSETSETLQAYAREISQSTKGPNGALESTLPSSGRPSTATSTVTLPSTRSAVPTTTTKSRFADKLKSAFANGNPELQAFAARAKERDMLIGGDGARNPTASAPAKMQHSSAYQASSSQISSFGSVASSAGSWSEDGGVGRHWASTSSRRTRVGGVHKQSADAHGSRSAIEGDSVSLGGLHASRPGRPARTSRHHQISREQASTINSSPSPSRRSFTPLSSFSSVTSYDAQSSGSHAQSSSPSGLGAGNGRSLRSPLHSIEESAYAYGKLEKTGLDDDHGDVATPLSASTVLETARPIIKVAPSSQQPQVIREPKAPPSDGFHSSTSSSKTLHTREVTAPPPQADVSNVEVSPSAPAPRARIGKFFGKFGRS